MKNLLPLLIFPLVFALAFVSCQEGAGDASEDNNARSVSQVIHELADLPYAHDALEPHIDEKTMMIHHGRHHQAYVNNLNNAIAGTPLADMDLIDIFAEMSQHSMAVRNNGGGHYNHDLFWNIMSPDGGGEPEGDLAEAISSTFGSFEDFQAEFKRMGMTQFGSGWAWLIVDADGNLKVTQTPNQDNPLMDVVEERGTPILGVDVWEHGYYLHYQNRRGDYIDAFWNVVDWNAVSELYAAALSS
ncbi:MAG: superoxide dismutase [Saprospirales bacterium]|nr:MAG: superoxide dismutase [Saprospirales bacterium]